MSAGETFPTALDSWTPDDWQTYRDRVADGEGSAATVDEITARRRTASEAADAEASQ